MLTIDPNLDELHEIRDIMRRSTTFMSLTGLAGVMAGLYGIAASVVASLILKGVWLNEQALARIAGEPEGARLHLALTAVGALIAALLTGMLLTLRKARTQNLAAWDGSSRRFALHLFIPLLAGAAFVAMFLLHGQYQFVVPAMLLFFGCALLAAARFVPLDMVWFALGEIALGLAACFALEAGLLLWLAGFGLLPIIYGTVMYLKYER